MKIHHLTAGTLPRTSIFLLLLMFLIPGIGIIAQDDNVVINITGNGPNATYVKEGDASQNPVTIEVGQTVRWVNKGNLPHTASTTNRDEQNRRIFSTGLIQPDEQADVLMDQELFERAGGSPGEQVTLEYFCLPHGIDRMKSSIVLKSPSPVFRLAVSRRKDITTLSPRDLRAYQDAWREIQRNGSYAEVAGYHDCPRGFCHRDRNVFIAWHREYLVKLERELQAVDPSMALHYWDWTSRTSISTGIPSAFTAPTFVSLKDGRTYANPLRTFRFNCGGQNRNTVRRPGSPSGLGSIARSVRSAYRSTSYVSFDRAIEGPHGDLHGWVGRDMSRTTYAAYDPIFWAHHSNVDRQWASWQRGGGPDPSSSIARLPLRGFPGRTVGDVVSTSALNYEYDRYDSTRGFVPFTRPLFANRGVFPDALTRPSDDFFELMATGIPDHPKKSLTFRVFVNDDDASLGDAIESNDCFAGSFSIFGGRGGHDMPSSVERSVLVFSPKLQARLRKLQDEGSAVSIKILAIDPMGKEVPLADTPIKSVFVLRSNKEVLSDRELRIEKANKRMMKSFSPKLNFKPNSSIGKGSDLIKIKGIETKSSTKTYAFTGVSNKESFDEAYQDAVNQAQDELDIADGLLEIQVARIAGERGSIGGKTLLKVTVLVNVK